VGHKVLFPLLEAGHLQVYERKFVIKDFKGVLFQQLHLPQVPFLTAWVRKAKVQDANRVNGFQVVIPIPTLGRLLLQGKSGVKDTAVFEVQLAHVLHLNDELLAFLVFAIQIKHGFPVRFRLALVFSIQIRQIPDLFPLSQHLIQKVNQQFLVELGAKQLLEAKVGEGIDVSVFAAHASKITIHRHSRRFLLLAGNL
jgi:hypothetical protein